MVIWIPTIEEKPRVGAIVMVKVPSCKTPKLAMLTKDGKWVDIKDQPLDRVSHFAYLDHLGQ